MIKINDDLFEKYNTNSQIEFKNLMLKSSLCDYSDACILVKEEPKKLSKTWIR